MKTYLLSVLLLLTISVSLAQLTVTNDAFIFVDGSGFDDTVVDTAPLFVNQDINLRDANSTIYLRNEAQVIQGTDVNNSGLGRLSVFQDGNVNEYAYNYWCSPVGNIDVNDTANRPFRANNQLYDHIGDPDPLLDPITSTQALFISGLNGVSSPLQISNFWLYSYDAGLTYNDWDGLGSTNNLATGYGFTMKGTIGSGSNQLYDFRGKPNSGTITTTVIDSYETLVGNPYPSALDALSYIHDPQNIAAMTGELFYWEQNAGANSHYLEDYVGGYATYTISSGGVDSFTFAPFSFYTVTGNPIALPVPQNGSKVARRYIPVGQGFFINGSVGTTGTVYTRNTHRVFYKETGASSEFFRTNNSQSTNDATYNEYGVNIVPSDFKRFRVNVDLEQTYTRQLLLNFHDTATDGFDYGLEGKINTTLASDAYCIFNNKPFNIQAFSFNQNLAIPIVVKAEFDQLVTFRIFDIQNFDDAQPIFIHDILNNTFVDLRIQNFEINLPAGNHPNRFEIVFQAPNALSNEEFTDANFNVFQNNNTSELVILNTNSLKIEHIKLYDVSGKLIFDKIIKDTNTRLSYSTKSLSDGLYLVKTTLSNSNTTIKKIVILNKE